MRQTVTSLMLALALQGCREAAGPTLSARATPLRGMAFTLVAVDGGTLPMVADFPTGTPDELESYWVRGGSLQFSSSSDSAVMQVGQLDPVLAGTGTVFMAGTHTVDYVTRDSVTFDAAVVGPLIVGPFAVARLRADTLHLTTIRVITTFPSNWPFLPPAPRPSQYGLHSWIFVRGAS